MDELLKLLESCHGKRTLSLYQADGMCWHKRGELKVTEQLLEQLRRAVSANGESNV